MRLITKITALTAISLLLSTSVAFSAHHGNKEGHDMSSGHETMSHSDMAHGEGGHDMKAGATEAMGEGTIHRISKLNRTVNLTHAPIPALNWPEMTMDLPVAKSVDLNSVKAGDHVKFHLELGDDKKYIITKIMK